MTDRRDVTVGTPAVLLSATAFDQPPLPRDLPTWLEARPRRSDYGLDGWRARLAHIRSGWRIALDGRKRDAVVIAHAGLEAMVAAPLLRLLSPRTRVVLLDPLLPASRRGDRLIALTWRRLHRLLVVRRGDVIPLTRRTRIPPERIRFIPYVVRAPDPATDQDGYVYAAGYAHRDWPTTVAALEQSGLPAILATDALADIAVPPNVEVRPQPTPADGRAMAAQAAVVAVVIADTELPAGPLVLMDAMALGKAVVATEVNGTRDYIEDGVTGLLVPPHDPTALAEALTRLMGDPEEARRLGAAARREALSQWSPERFIERLAEELTDLGVEMPAGTPGRKA